MNKLSNTEAEMKKALLIKKHVIQTATKLSKIALKIKVAMLLMVLILQ